MVHYEDIRNKPDEYKTAVYQRIQALWLEGKKVVKKAHRSGFPAITLDCEDLHYITDILSLEDFWRDIEGEDDEKKV